MRFYDAATGDPLLSSQERAQAEAQRADAEAQRADAEARRAGVEARRADVEAQRALAEMEARVNAEAVIVSLRSELEAIRRRDRE